MIETSGILKTKDGVLIPSGTPLQFKNGTAKYQNHIIERKLVPLEAIKGAKGPFLHACCAILLNDNRGFQEQFKIRYQDWAHFIIAGDNMIVYVWDTRQVIDVFTGMYNAVKGGPIIRTLVSKETGKTMQQTIGNKKFGWAKSVYDMITFPQYHRPDNGLPLVNKNAKFTSIIDAFNNSIAKFAFEAFVSDNEREQLASIGDAMPDGSYPIRNADDLHNAIQAYGRAKDKEAVKHHIIERAIDLGLTNELPETWFNQEPAAEALIGARGRECHVYRYVAGLASIIRRFKTPYVESEPWLHIALSYWQKPSYAIYVWDTRKVLASGNLTDEQGKMLASAATSLHAYANDNAFKLVGSGTAISIINASMNGNPIATSVELANDVLQIVPAEGEANKHNVWLGNSIVACIVANKLEQMQVGYKNPDELNDKSNDVDTADKSDTASKDDIPYSGKVYKNLDDNRLMVLDVNGDAIDLACLKEPAVPEQVLLDELGKNIVATENLSDDLFDNYDNKEGFPDGIKVLYINDLFEFCQLLASKCNNELPKVVFAKNMATVYSNDLSIVFDFANMTYCIHDVTRNKGIYNLFIKQHFAQKLSVCK